MVKSFIKNGLIFKGSIEMKPKPQTHPIVEQKNVEQEKKLKIVEQEKKPKNLEQEKKPKEQTGKISLPKTFV